MGLSLYLNSSNESNKVGENWAEITYQASLDNASSVTVKRVYGQVGNQHFSGRGYGELKVTGLSPANSNINLSTEIYGKVTYEYEYEQWAGVDENGNNIYDTIYDEVTYTDSIIVFLHPGPFDMEANSNSIIANVLTKEKIDEWEKHFQKAYQWWNQSSRKYSTNLKVNKGDIITASWFNKCMDAMNIFGKGYPYVNGAIDNPPGDLITADLINQMNFSGKS